MIDSLRDLLVLQFSISDATRDRLLTSLLIVIVIYLLQLVIIRLVQRRLSESDADARSLYYWRKTIQYVTVTFAILLAGRVWLEGVQSLATYLGLVSAGLAIALQDLIVNLAGWLFILWRRPFAVGDRIELGASAGDVIDTRLFEFTLLEIGHRIAAEQSTGRLIHIPNGKIFKDMLVNYSQGLPFIWNEIPVLVTFESNWEAARDILSAIVNEHSPDTSGMKDFAPTTRQRFIISYRNMGPTVYTQVESSGVLLTMRYLVNPRQRRSSEHQIWEAVLTAFGPRHDIDFAYDTQRKYDHFLERKRPSSSQDHPAIEGDDL